MSRIKTEFLNDIGDLVGEGVRGRWGASLLARRLVMAQKSIALKLLKHQCWTPLRKLAREENYTLTGATSYDLYTVLNNYTELWKIISGRLDDYHLRHVTPHEEVRIGISGEYYPLQTAPYWMLWATDMDANHQFYPTLKVQPYTSTKTVYFKFLRQPGERALAYTGGSNVNGGTMGTGIVITGGTSGATCIVKYAPDPSSGTWAGADAAGTLYVTDKKGIFTASESCTWGDSSDVLTVTADPGSISAFAHDNAISDLIEDCEEAIIYRAALDAWLGDRNSNQYTMLKDRFMDEMNDLIGEHEDPYYEDVRLHEVE